MYKVQWCDHEGDLNEQYFAHYENAEIEAEYLREAYGWAEVVGP